jgi:hypothetical protein
MPIAYMPMSPKPPMRFAWVAERLRRLANYGAHAEEA